MPFRQMFVVHMKKQLKELYMSIGIFSFAFSLIAIFEPIFLYQQQFPIWAIALYYAIHYALYVFLLPLGGKFASRFGLGQSLLFSLPFFILYFISLAVIPKVPIAILASILFLTLHKIFYWPAYYGIFARFSDPENRGTELSWLGVFQYGAGILGPLVGGFVASLWGFPTLFLFAATLVLFSGLPLMKMKRGYRGSEFSYDSPWKMMRLPEYRNTFIATLGWGENLIDVVFWPLFLFLTLGSLDSIGIYLSLSLFIMTLISFFIGERAEHYRKGRLLRLYLPFMVLSYVFRMIAFSPIRIVPTDILARVSLAGIMIPLMYKVYSQAKTTRSLEFVVAFEIVLAIAKSATALLIAFFFLALPVSTAFTATFFMAMLIALLYGKL